MGGMVLETNMPEILTHIEAETKIEKQEVMKILQILQTKINLKNTFVKGTNFWRFL